MPSNSRRSFLKSATAGGSAFALSSFGFGLRPSPQYAPHGEFLNAIKSGDLRQAKILLKQDKSLIDAKDDVGRSAYAIALLAGHSEIASWLARSGFQPDLHELALGLSWKELESKASEFGGTVSDEVNRNHPIGGTAMLAAAVGGAGTDIWRVYAQGGDPNRVFKGNQMTPLQMALRFRDAETAELTAFTLLSNAANADVHLSGDLPPLHLAAERGFIDIAEMLIRLGAKVELKDDENRTALELAQTHGQKDVAQLLIGHEKIPKIYNDFRFSRNRDGDVYQEPSWDQVSVVERSQFVGASHGQLDVIKNKLSQDERFAHSYSTTSERAVEAGAHMGNRPIVELLLEKSAPYSLPTAVMMGDTKRVKRYLDEDPNRIHERGAHDFPLLWYPIIGKSGVEMMQLLMDRGAQVERQSQMGTTALHWASGRAAGIEYVKLLIENGANVNRVGRKFGGRRMTPLQMARDPKVINLLKSAGAE